MLSNTFSATKELSNVAQDLSDRQSQLAYQLDENIATTKDLRITLMKRTLKGAMNSAFKTDNLWSGFKHILDKQIQQEREIKALKEKLTASNAKFEEANRLETSHREEVKIMRKGVRLTETLLLKRITALEEDVGGKTSKQSVELQSTGAFEALERSYAT